MRIYEMPAAGGGEDRDLIENAAYPTTKTDADGIGRFDSLLPGRYRLMAVAENGGANRGRSAGWPFDGGASPHAECEGISVRTGETTNFRIAIYSPPKAAAFRELQPNGGPYRGHVCLNYGQRDAGSWSTSIELDASGNGRVPMKSVGLGQFEASYRESPISGFPFGEPFLAVNGTVAASPNLLTDFVPTLTVRRVEPASAKISVRDGAGKPLRAVVEIDRPLYFADASASTDENGEVLFTGLYAWDDYIVRAFIPGDPPLDLGEYDGPLPSDEQLQRRMEIVAVPPVRAA